MDKKGLLGQMVTLRSSLGSIDRVVVKDLGDVLLVCRPEELKAAKLEGREPHSIGFKRADLVT